MGGALRAGVARGVLACAGAMALPGRRSLSLALAALLALPLCAGGCASPTLPLPPPEPPETKGFSDGVITLQGSALPSALVYALNQNQEQGVIVKATDAGVYTVSLKADSGNTIAIWQEQGSERSPSILVTARPLK